MSVSVTKAGQGHQKLLLKCISNVPTLYW